MALGAKSGKCRLADMISFNLFFSFYLFVFIMWVHCLQIAYIDTWPQEPMLHIQKAVMQIAPTEICVVTQVRMCPQLRGMPAYEFCLDTMWNPCKPSSGFDG